MLTNIACALFYILCSHIYLKMTRKRVTTAKGNRVVAYTTKREAMRAKDKAPAADRVRKIKKHRTKSGIKRETLFVVEKAKKYSR